MSSLEIHSIERCPHDSENPYTMISRDLIRDKSISPQARWFVIFCLSYDRKWNISIPHFMKDQGISKDRMYSILKEATESGYIRRHHYMEGGLKRYKYYVSEKPQLKKFLPYPENPHTALCPENPDTGNQDTKNKQSSSSLHSEEEKKEQYKEAPTSSPPSADASFLYDFFLKKIRERSPEFKDPNRKKWEEHFDRLLRIDKRDPAKVVQLIIWASEHKWWKTACLSPEKLRKDYDVMVAQMAADSEKSVVRTNRQYALNMKDKYPHQLKALSFDDKFVMNRAAGKEISFSMQHEAFVDAFLSLFGGSRG